MNINFWYSYDNKSMLLEIGIFSFVSFLVAMPVLTINFNNYVVFWKKKINRISTYLDFLFMFYFEIVQLMADCCFKICLTTRTAITGNRTKSWFPSCLVRLERLSAMFAIVFFYKPSATFPTTINVSRRNAARNREFLLAIRTNFYNCVKLLLTFSRTKSTAFMVFPELRTQIKGFPTILTDMVCSRSFFLWFIKLHFIISHWHKALKMERPLQQVG